MAATFGPFNTSAGVKASQAVGYEAGKGGGFSTSWTTRLFTRLYSGWRAMAPAPRIAPNYSQRGMTSSGEKYHRLSPLLRVTCTVLTPTSNTGAGGSAEDTEHPAPLTSSVSRDHALKTPTPTCSCHLCNHDQQDATAAHHWGAVGTVCTLCCMYGNIYSISFVYKLTVPIKTASRACQSW